MQLDDYLAYKPLRQAKFVVYTAISGDFDDLIQHTYVSKDADYVCYTDQNVPHPGIWEIRPLKTQQLDRVRSAKYYKFFPNELFPEAQYSVWIDGNIDVLNDALERSVDALILAKAAIASNIHFSRDCTYAEALVCRNALLDDSAVILKQIQYLKQQQFPHNYGLFESNMIFRDHHRPSNITLMHSWWEMIQNYSRRDQLSFGFALFQNQLSCEVLFPINPRLGSDFSFKPHNKKMLSTLYVDTGSGFNEQDIWPGDGVIRGGTHFIVAFEHMPFSAIKQLRFDPVDGQFCRLLLERINLTFSSGEEQSIPFTEIETLCSSNGVKETDGMTAFETFDPHVTLPLSGDIKRLVVQGQIQHIQPGNKINTLVQRAEQLTSQHDVLLSQHDVLLSQHDALFSQHDGLRSQHAALGSQYVDLTMRLEAATSTNQMLGQHLDQSQQTNKQLETSVSELQARVQAMLASRTWRAGKALLWLPKALFKRG